MAEEKKAQTQSGGSNVRYKGTKSGRTVDVVWVGDLALGLGEVTPNVSEAAVKALKDEDGYYSDYEFDFDVKESS